MSNRAYSLLTIKAVDEEQRIITGIASTIEVDRMGDIVEPKGAVFKLPLPLLWQHNSREPIGFVTDAKITANGIEITAQIANETAPGKLKDLLDFAWQCMKNKLVRGLSIGFDALEYTYIEGTYGLRFLSWEWLELSAVTIPANADATIQSVKSHDAAQQAASGHRRAVLRPSTTPGDSGSPRAKARRTDPTMKTRAEKILDIKSSRAAAIEKLNKLNDEVPDGELMSNEMADECKDLETEVKAFDRELERLERLDALNSKSAAPVRGETKDQGSESRDTSSRIVTLKRNDPPGTRFARAAMCLMAAKGSRADAMAFAQEFYSGDEGVQAFIKAAVAGATTSNLQAPAAQYTDLVNEFIEYLRPLTILGKFGTTMDGVTYPALTKVDFYTRTNRQTAGGTGSWVGEGKPAPLTKGAFDTVTLAALKVGAISVLTKESIRFGTSASEQRVRNDLTRAIIATQDITLLDPANAGTANVKPASLTNGVVATAVSGTTAAAFRVDLKNMLQTMIAAGIQGNSLVLVMSQGIALSLSLMRNALGNREFPDLTMRGGYVEGIPVIASEAVTALGSPSTNMIAAINAEDVFLADDGSVEIESSDQASVEMLDGSLVQNGTNGTGASLVSLWQTGMLGLKASREINWTLARSTAVQYLSPVAYVPS
jgi:HK97 family phage major capsid protein/HK97 family phage prohead protease